MENLGKQLLNSAQESAEGSGNSVGAHLLSKLAGGNDDSKLVTKAIHQVNIRGGRGSKGEPSEVSESIKKAQEDAVRIDHTLAKLKNEKGGLLLELADFRVKERQLVEAGRAEEVSAIRKAMANTQGKIDKVNGVLPETTATEDHKRVQAIISEFYAEKHKKEKAVEKLKQAEEKLETAPSDGRVLGDAIRGETEKVEAEERLAEVTRNAELILEKETPNPARDEGVHHTNDETVAEKEYIQKRHSERVAQGAFDQKKEGKEATVGAEITPEPKDGSFLPITTESVGEPVGIPREGQEEAFEKFVAIPEKKIVTKEQVLANIALLDEGVGARAEKAGMDKGVLRRVGDRWNKVPTRYKLLISAGMIATGFAVETAAAAGAVAAIGAGLRFIGGTGLFATFDGMLEKRAMKDGVERSALKKGSDKFVSAGLAIIIAGVLPNMARDYAVEHGLFQKISEFFGFGNVTIETPMEAPVESGEYIQIAKDGDNVWKMAGNIVNEKFPQLSADQKTHLIDAIKDRIKDYPGSYGLTDANKIIPGQGVDFGGIFGDKEFMDNALSSAKDHTLEQVANIKNVDASVPAETPARTVSANEFLGDEFLNEQLHTTFTPEDATPVVTEQVIPVPEQVVLPVESYVAHTNAIVESEGLKGTFKYSENGAVESFSMEGSASATDGHKMLNENWREVVRSNPSAGGENMDITAVNANATTVSMYEQMLDTLEKKGAGASPEADFLRKSIEDTVVDTEKMHGDVFKNIEDFGKLKETIPIETNSQEIAPEEPKDVLMEGAIHEASEQYVPTSFIQPEILPGDTAELAYVMASADAIINTDMDILFGESKFLGFGHTSGIDSINWKDPQVGFGGKTVTEIMKSTPSAFPAEGGKTFGVENYEATNKMKEYLSSVTHMTGVNPNSNEKVVDFIRRASIVKLSK